MRQTYRRLAVTEGTKGQHSIDVNLLFLPERFPGKRFPEPLSVPGPPRQSRLRQRSLQWSIDHKKRAGGNRLSNIARYNRYNQISSWPPSARGR
ncbi:MAG: hypothetical protein ACK6D3_24380 [Planctomycetaceae bacterium]